MALWLSNTIPDLAAGTAVEDYEPGLILNATRSVDLWLVLPLMLAAAISLWRSRPFGVVMGPAMLTFVGLLCASLVSSLLTMQLNGLDTSTSLMAALLAVALLCFAALALLLPQLRWSSPAQGAHPPANVRISGANKPLVTVTQAGV